MRRKTMVLLLLSIFTFLLAGKNAGNKQQNTQWKQIKNRQEILIAYRWINTNNNTQMKELKAETCIHLPKDILLKIIQSGMYTSEWMSTVGNYYVKQGINQHQWESQITFDLFGPLSNNNLEINYTLLDDCEDSSFIMFKSKQASLFNKTIRPEVYQFNGSWEFLPQGDNETKIILKTRWNKSNILPHWFISSILSDNIFHSLKMLKHLSEDKYIRQGNLLAVIDF